MAGRKPAPQCQPPAWEKACGALPTLAALAILALALAAGPARAGGNSPRVGYMLHCMGCHLNDGRGTPGKVPPLAGSVGRFLQVEGGREYLVQVPGVAQAALDDADLAGVLNWMLESFSARELPAEFTPYTPEEVGRYRRHKLVEVSEVRASLIAEMPPADPSR